MELKEVTIAVQVEVDSYYDEQLAKLEAGDDFIYRQKDNTSGGTYFTAIRDAVPLGEGRYAITVSNSPWACTHENAYTELDTNAHICRECEELLEIVGR